MLLRAELGGACFLENASSQEHTASPAAFACTPPAKPPASAAQAPNSWQTCLSIVRSCATHNVAARSRVEPKSALPLRSASALQGEEAEVDCTLLRAERLVPDRGPALLRYVDCSMAPQASKQQQGWLPIFALQHASHLQRATYKPGSCPLRSRSV